ncbi:MULTISPECIES: TolC family outer membrane protein [Pseudomonas]|uniref:TolC family outer membrane protein n=1 Tax=Pseudomonas donghuensis TaxID=1163398 RepID=A0AAP0XAP4_9PSED|nr:MULTISPECIES: TolC family outer membrane protein [Pseudomonas]MBS7598049.1 TolC family outer membrane protein [Pseudomonas sp. RC2C2]KDO00179.1 TolC family outer membrane protein [Pseudomonas donghuensis]MCP6692855.1 TolC family outer membrane protein [Pseudomonas donghuensis]MCP6698892.1 TolC family outer membrane protein [Pseudomonas donghuensis]UVL23850.1 TolC family outer membrane protein [Pseudomonas donghuensis]
MGMSSVLFGGVFMLAAGAALGQTAAPASTGVSASTFSTDLMQLYREARLEDPRVLASFAQAQAGKEHQREAMGALLPQLSLNAGSNRIHQENDLIQQSYDSESYSLVLRQYLYNKAAWENYQKFKSLARQSESQALDAQAEATVELARRYFTALAAEDELELVRAERRTTQKSLDRVNALYEKQLALVTDQLDLKARVDLLAAQELDARNQASISREALAEIVGRPVKEKLNRIRDDAQLRVSAQSMEDWVREGIAQNPTLKASESGVEAAGAALRSGKGGHYPTVSLNLSAQETNEGYNNSQTPRTDSYVAGIGVQVPLYSGGSTSARVRGLYQDQLTAEQELEAIRRQVVKEITSAYLTANSNGEKIHANRLALASAKLSRVAAEKALTYGMVNAVDVLASVRNEFRARRDLLKTQYEFLSNVFTLNRWAGKPPAESVDSVNGWLSPGSPAQATDVESEY